MSIFKLIFKIRAAFWELIGFRRVVAFGQSLKLSPKTEFPTSWRFPLPKGRGKERVVRYGDFVQCHALVQAINRLAGPVYVVDVGAFHGSYAVILGSMVGRKGGKVIAVEPNPESFEILKDNIRRNRLLGTVFAEQCAISDVEGGLSKILLKGSQSQIVKDPADPGDGTFVRSKRLETLLVEHALPRIDVLIVDVEGAELEVLRSLSWNQPLTPTILCELHCNEWAKFGHSANDFSEFLKTHGLVCIDTYLEHHSDFSTKGYLGPCILVPIKPR